MSATSLMTVEIPAVGAARHGFGERCNEWLERAQGADGGWPWHPGERSATEATAWSLVALGGAAITEERCEAIERGIAWLERTQLADGGWAAFAGQGRACWVTAPACLALAKQGGSEEATARGAKWLCESWPAEGGAWWRLRSRMLGRSSVVEQDSKMRGWSWMPKTASWVEPTAHALMALHAAGKELRPAKAAERMEMGEAMLYDRMCEGGGWNSGNPRVYGVSGIARIGPTAQALLALRGHEKRAENQASLDWLENEYEKIEGPGSLAAAHLSLAACGRKRRDAAERLEEMHAKNGFLSNIGVTAWVGMALGGACGWLGRAAEEVEE